MWKIYIIKVDKSNFDSVYYFLRFALGRWTPGEATRIVRASFAEASAKLLRSLRGTLRGTLRA